jgi:hypothetical protein
MDFPPASQNGRNFDGTSLSQLVNKLATSLLRRHRPLAKIISLRGIPLGNIFSVIQCIVPWILDYHKKFPSKKLAKHRENG